ncbi:hypothetical protein ACOJBO_10655 [Rhizobium beringeri]
MTDNDDKKGGHDKTITIVVNGTPHQVPKKDELTYAEVVTYFDPDLSAASADGLLRHLHPR